MADAAQRLLAWYHAHRRPLPWRATRDPYRIWVSEVMLQQTRVAYVRDYYRRFVAALPSVQALAAASETEVLALWSGLGYYRRARQLHAAARQIVASEGGFPETVEGLRALPGVGPYTAAAVASIAFGVPVQVLDGNVERVLARLGGYEDEVRSAQARRHLLGIGRRWFDTTQPGDSNQALMELGAVVCLPRNPGCVECPLAADCVARASGDVERYPRPRQRPARRRERILAARVERDGRLLMFRRPEDSALLPGTWELPWVAIETDTGEAAALLGARYGGAWRLGRAWGTVRHAITSRILSVEIVAADVVGDSSVAEAREARWLSPADLESEPHSSLTRKVLKLSTPPAVERSSIAGRGTSRAREG